MKHALTFEEAWRSYVNGNEEDADRLLQACVKAATTLEELIRVFNASFDQHSERVRPAALKKMLEMVQNVTEARQVYALASGTGPNGYIFPARHREAKAKLESFEAIV